VLCFVTQKKSKDAIPNLEKIYHFPFLLGGFPLANRLLVFPCSLFCRALFDSGVDILALIFPRVSSGILDLPEYLGYDIWRMKQHHDEERVQITF
jgi:hypothetical protein